MPRCCKRWLYGMEDGMPRLDPWFKLLGPKVRFSFFYSFDFYDGIVMYNVQLRGLVRGSRVSI